MLPRKQIGFSLIATLGLVAASCGENRVQENIPTSTLTMNLNGGDFSNTSVRIIGNRSVAADSKYRCNNSFNSCFALTGSNPSVTVEGLCPSTNAPSGTWTYTYEIYSSSDCTGSVLNNWDADAGQSPNNFVCYDSRDLFAQARRNTTYQVNVQPGTNDAAIACLTTNGQNNFSFSSCAVTTSTPLTLDCGCTNTSGTCSCGTLKAGTGGNLPSNCSMSAPACSIVCN